MYKIFEKKIIDQFDHKDQIYYSERYHGDECLQLSYELYNNANNFHRFVMFTYNV